MQSAMSNAVNFIKSHISQIIVIAGIAICFMSKAITVYKTKSEKKRLLKRLNYIKNKNL